MSDKITIIGIGDDGMEGLTRQALDLIQNAGTLLGPASLLEKVPENGATRISLGADLDQVAKTLTTAVKQPLVMLASGDPLFYGITRYLCEKIGKERFEVLPHVSSMQLAFARVKESWDEAYLTNLASQSLAKVIQRIRTAERVGIFTSQQASPADVAKALLEQGISYFTAYVCENLGSRDERVTRGTLQEIAGQSFAPLNVMILIRLAGVPDRPVHMQGRRLFGNPDEYFVQGRPKRGLLTRSEVRVIALSEMDLGPDSIVWDVGAGSGSVSIEAAQLAPNGQVFAIEMDAEDYNRLIENIKAFGTTNVTPILGEAPKAWNELPDPDAIFVGGTGRFVVSLLQAAWPRLKPGGRLVVNISSLDNLTAAESALRELCDEPGLLMVNISRGQQQLESLRLEASNPSFLLTAVKPNHA